MKPTVEPSQAPDPGSKEGITLSRWLRRIEREKKAHKGFRALAKSSMENYQPKCSDETGPEHTRYPIWWSNTKITKAAIYGKQPKPDVRRRQTAANADKKIALAIERAIAYQLDTTPFDEHSGRAVVEFLVAGLGTFRHFLKTESEKVPVINPMTMQPIMDESGQMVMRDEIKSQAVGTDYVPWDCFRWEPKKDWEEVSWVSFDRWLTADAIFDEFKVRLSKAGATGDDGGGNSRGALSEYSGLHLVHEIWDKEWRQVITICSTAAQTENRILKTEPDPLNLRDFFPCPRPMMMNVRSGELTPSSEWLYVKQLCNDIDELSGRIRKLVKTIKDVGFYDAAIGAELQTLLEEPDGSRIPVNGLLEKFRDTSLSQVVILEEIRPKIEVVVQLVQERERVKQELYELTGIADIIRGATKASETLGAQQLKAQWANVRLTDKMLEVAGHMRGSFRIMAELISEHFTPEQIQQQTGVQITPEMQQIMKSDLGRCYAIDIETDSTIAQDEQAEQQARVEFIQGFTAYVSQVMPLVTQGILPADMANAALLFFVGSYRHGRIMEEQVEQMPGTMKQIQDVQQKSQQAEQQLQQMQQQMQQMQEAQQQQAEQAAQETAKAQQEIMRLEAELQAAKQQESPVKQMREVASARNQAAQAERAEADAARTRQETAQAMLYGQPPVSADPLF